MGAACGDTIPPPFAAPCRFYSLTSPLGASQAIEQTVRALVGRKTFTRLGETKPPDAPALAAGGGKGGVGKLQIPEYVISEVLNTAAANAFVSVPAFPHPSPSSPPGLSLANLSLLSPSPSSPPGPSLPPTCPDDTLFPPPRSQVITEELVGGEQTSIGQINAVMNELNSLLKQSVVGSRLRGDDVVGAAAGEGDGPLDTLLQEVMSEIVAGAAEAVQMIEETPLVQAIVEAGNRAAEDGDGACRRDFTAAAAALDGPLTA